MKAQMTAIVVRDSEGFFDDPKESEDLQITVRVSCEFFVFLQSSNDVPELANQVHGWNNPFRNGLVFLDGSDRPHSDWIEVAVRVRSQVAEHLFRTESVLRICIPPGARVYSQHQSDWVAVVPRATDVPIHDSLFPVVPVIF
jgi:hypothetical protein